jgi:hypothetical protein
LLSTVTVRKADRRAFAQQQPLVPFSFTHNNECFHSLQREIIDKVKNKLGGACATPDSLALSIFHYTNDDRGVTTTRRYAEGTG